jgi:uncharacterized membrane protein YeiB
MTAQGGPTGLTERALGPDLARGFMLLFIALANSHYFVYGSGIFGGFPTDGSALDRAVGFVIATFVDGRAFPMFGVLFGYGVAQIVRRQREAGKEWWPIRRLLWRRSLVLVVLGFLHAMLVYIGDILAAYGVLLFLGVWALRWKDRTLFIVAALVLVVSSLPSDDTLAIATDAADPSMLPLNLLDLSRTLSTTTTALLAIATWLATVLLADRMRRVGYRGPFEILIRRITYQPSITAATRSRSSGSRA